MRGTGSRPWPVIHTALGALALVAAAAVSPLAAGGGPVAEVTTAAGSIVWEPRVDYERARVVVSGRQGIVFRGDFEPSELLSFSAVGTDGAALPDGWYTGELRLLRGIPSEVASEGAGPPELLTRSDRFEIVSGSIRISKRSPVGQPESDLTITDASPSLVFDDTSAAGQEWFLDGWEEGFALWDNTSLNHTFTVEPGGQANTLYLNPFGEVGVGTAAPEDTLHIVDGVTYLRLEQSQGTWQIGGSDDLWFNLVDDGSGNSLDRILVLEDDAAATPSGTGVGVYEQNPEASLHVSSPGGDGSAKLIVEEMSGTVANRRLLELQNNGPVTLRYINNAPGGTDWNMNALNGGFTWSVAGSGVNEGQLDPSGNLFLTGQVFPGSSRSMKTAFADVDHGSVLTRLADLPLAEWSYSRDEEGARHLGPMSEDFHRAFGLGDEAHLSPSDSSGVALAALQGLIRVVEEQRDEIVRLRGRLARIEARLAEASP